MTEQGDNTSRRRTRTLSTPLAVAEFWKNRRGESIRVTLSTFEGYNIADIRQHYTDSAGKMRPTKKGLTVVVLRLPELEAAIRKALQLARENGLLPDDSGAAT